MDKLSPEQRHKNMSAIRSKDTKPERIVRRGLWRMGFRYRLNTPRLPGHPDLVLRKYRTCIFVNGCFWHGHHVTWTDVDGEVEPSDSACCRIPVTNRDFWVAKIRRNQQRDAEEMRQLAAMGWHTVTVWECGLQGAKREATLKSLAFTLNKIWLDDHRSERPYPSLEEEDSGWPMAAEGAAE